MREIDISEITKNVKKLCVESNCILNDDIYNSIKKSAETEVSEIGKDILEKIVENADIAKEKMKPICQDTGMAVVFMEIGQDVHIKGGDITEGINEGVRLGYKEGYLRKSVVGDPLLRLNTKDNTPAVIHYNIVPGDKVKIIVAPKGFGSENMSKIYMLKPSQGVDGVKEAIINTIKTAGSNPCPPMVVGVGIGGNFEMSAYLAKKALLRDIDKSSPIPHIKQLEEELYKSINKTGIGPQGLGGKTTILGINIETFATHIAGLPVAVNISCHVTRHKEIII